MVKRVDVLLTTIALWSLFIVFMVISTTFTYYPYPWNFMGTGLFFIFGIFSGIGGMGGVHKLKEKEEEI